MTSELETRKGFEIGSSDKKLFISNQELISHGCKNCIWRLHNQCSHDIVKDNEFYEFTEKDVKHSGYCMEYVNFLLGFAEGQESISAVWEKFSLYVSRMQSLEDYKEYINLSEEIKTKEAEGVLPKDMAHLLEQKEILRLYWERLNFMLQKGYSRVADRESKSRDSSRTPIGIMGARTVNFNMIEKK